MCTNIILRLYTHCTCTPTYFVHFKHAGAAEIAAEIQRAPLPNFDGVVTRKIRANEPELVWNSMLRQAAAYYYSGWPDIEDSSIYRIIGQKMMAEFPAIKQEGANSWVSADSCKSCMFFEGCWKC